MAVYRHVFAARSRLLGYTRDRELPGSLGIALNDATDQGAHGKFARDHFIKNEVSLHWITTTAWIPLVTRLRL